MLLTPGRSFFAERFLMSIVLRLRPQSRSQFLQTIFSADWPAFWPSVWIACLLIVGMPHAHSQEVSVRAELSAQQITRDESVMLTITAQGIDAELDSSSLSENFDVVSRSSSREISTTFSNNNQLINVSVVRWVLELLPKGQGVFTVPSVQVGDYETQLLTLNVSDIPTGASRDIFLEASVDTAEPWVQSQVVMSLRVFQAIDIVDGGLDSPSADNMTVQRIGEDTQSLEERDGREYRVTERRFALFPQKSGPITIEPVILNITVPADPSRVRGFFSPTRKLTRRSDAIELNVLPRPSTNAAWWLPAKALEIQAQWQSDPASAQVDQPLTRTLVMQAQGVLQSQLPEINIPAIDGVSLYAEDPRLTMDGDDSGLIAEQRINWALIPQRSGPLTLPAVSVEWFNTRTGQNETAQLPAETIIVAPASASSNNSANLTTNNASSDQQQGVNSALNDSSTNPLSDTASADLQQSLAIQEQAQLQSQGPRITALEDSVQRWRALALITLFAVLLAVLYWIFKRSSASRQASKSTAYSAVQNRLMPLQGVRKTAKQGDLLTLKIALMQWAGEQWTTSPPTTIDGLCAKLPEGDARDTLAALQLALYSKNGGSMAEPVLQERLNKLSDNLVIAMKAIEQERMPRGKDKRKEAYQSLPPL